MGGKDSKPAFVTYEDAVRRVTDSELKRLKDAFKRSASLGGYMTRQTFIREVLGDGVPQRMADQMYIAFGGTSKGLTFKDLLCGLVLITRGKEEEKLKFIFGLYANENLSHVQKEQMDALVLATEGHVPHELSDLFKDTDRVPYERFKLWVLYHETVTSVTKWLLQEPCVVTLSNDLETPTFYQTLAGVTHLEESDIIELEKRYWILKGQSKSGRFDLDTFRPIVSPPVPEALVEGLFNAFDENRDNHIDFKEMACGISACCRGPMVERQKFCFKLFDFDHDNLLSKAEVEVMIRAMLAVRADNTPPHQMEVDGLSDTSALSLTLDILEQHDGDGDGAITQEEYLVWSVTHPLPAQFMQLLFQVCHVVLGLKPQTKEDEGLVINGWVEREERKVLQVGQTWYLVSMAWWKQWLDYVGIRSQLSPESNNNNKSLSAQKSASTGGGGGSKSLCSSIVGRKYSADGAAAGSGAGGGTSGTYSSLPHGATIAGGAGGAGGGGGVGASPTKYATLPRVSASSSSASAAATATHSSPMRSSNRTALDISPAVSQHSTPSHSPRLSKRSLANGGATVVPVLPQKPGQIDNSSLVAASTSKVPTLTNEGGRLRRDRELVRGRDYEILPEAVWKALVAWYGGTPALPRTVLQLTSTSQPELELYPLCVRLLRHQVPPQRPGAAQNGPNIPGPAAAAVNTFSGVMGGLGTMVANTTGLAGGNAGSGAGSVSAPRRNLAYTACFSRKHTMRQLYDFLAARLRIATDDIRLWKIKDEQTMTLLEEDDVDVGDLNLEENCQILIEVRNKDLTWPEELSQLAKQRAAASPGGSGGSGPQPRTTERGATGLNNLGNTCFMNSALQCVSNTRALTLYFTSGMHLYEINRTNPLGMKGHIAQRYGDLIKDIWSGTARSIAPLKLRWTIGKYAPRFNGYQQHDCQELLAFLLDGLHEDLNRVHDKPYVELKDSDGRPDEVVAKEAWENHLLRNRSVIVDLFCGQLKSEVRCKECGHTSVRFDPFTYLSLPLPMDSCIHLEITVMRLDGSTPTKYGLRLNMDEKYKGLKKQLSQLTSIPMPQILLVEVLGALVRSFPLDAHKIRGVNGGGGGALYAYELPPLPPIPIMTAAEERWLSQNPITISPAPATTAVDNPPPVPSNLGQIQRSNRPSAASQQAAAPAENTTSSANHTPQHNPTNPGTPHKSNPANQRTAAEEKTPPTHQTNKRNKTTSQQNTTATQNQNQNQNLPNSDATTTATPATATASKQPQQQQQQQPQHQLPNGTAVNVNATGTTGTTNGLDSPLHIPAGSRQHGGRDSGSSGASTASTISPGSGSLSTADVFSGFIVAVHRKTIRMDVYFLSSRKTRPSLFGTPLIIPCDDESTCGGLYQAVWTQVARLVSPLPPSETSNHAQDCDDSLRYEYPFSLKVVQKDGFTCAQCPWYRFCRGCALECSPAPFQYASCFIAIDWEPTALHLRYQTSQEKTYYEHISVAESRRLQTEPIDLDACLKAFTKEEHMAEDDLYHCSKCKTHQLAAKKLEIWKLPPVLIIHLKRFQYLNGRWVKSQKIVNFPFRQFDPTNYIAKRSPNIPDTTTNATAVGQSNGGLHISSVNGSTNHNREHNGSTGDGQPKSIAPSLPNGTAKPVAEHNDKKDAAEMAKEASEDGNLSDDPAEDYANVRYNVSALACHTGILGGGHYVAYGKNPNQRWYSYNDSMCREVAEEHIDKNSAYILFYEREGLDCSRFMPELAGREPDTSEIDDEFESDLKKMCVIQ